MLSFCISWFLLYVPCLTLHHCFLESFCHYFYMSLSICPCILQVRLPKHTKPNITMKLSPSLSTSTASSGKFICDSRSVSFTPHVFFQLAEAPVHYSEEHLGNHNSHGPAQKLMETHLRFFPGEVSKRAITPRGERGVCCIHPRTEGMDLPED